MTFKINEFTFVEISTDRKLNTKYFRDVLILLDKHKGVILNDYLPNDIEGIIQLINELFPWFFVILKDGKFAGFIYCYGWNGDGKKFHSCYLTAASDRKYYGKDTRKALTLFCNYLYDIMNLAKIKVEVLKENKLCIKLIEDCRFKKEGYLKANTFINDKPRDMLIYGKINPKYLTNINHNKETIGASK